MNKRELGNEKESIAIDYLKEQGYHILDRNIFNRFGELDIVAKDGQYLVFLEVKYRSNLSRGYPAEAVTRSKKKHIIQSAKYYMMVHHYSVTTPCRFDVVVLLKDQIEIIKNAFEIES